ncbi:BgTH12-07910 [Blumeria graminis f. sp. triticale]|uniref:BgTH12-07910 n=2 Tax=Blumeria graminis TaxID=34373 RepID=A0A9W4CZ50_BLUGR|nr:BgTH12-07910 [Blumeria graminis f. sp. triticale]
MLDNANPTVIDASELDSLRQKRRKKGETGRKDAVIDELFDQTHYKMDPFYMSEVQDVESDSDDSSIEPIDEQEIYELIAPISDPEHPLSLESLGVVKPEDVHLSKYPDQTGPILLFHVLVELTPTVTHCSLATVIGLGVRVRLEQALPPCYRIEVRIKKGTHSQADEVNKQLSDKERVAAALENENLLGILKKMMNPCLDIQI